MAPHQRGLALLGDNPAPTAPSAKDVDASPRAVLSSIAGGVAGALLWREHPVLGALGGSAIGRNAIGLLTKEISPKEAIGNIGSHAAATAGSLALPKYPIIGYVAGAVTGGFLFENKRTVRSFASDTDVIGTSWETAPSLDDVRNTGVGIRKGMKGPSVATIQQLLGISVDGEFGSDTETAVKKFQANEPSVTANGVVGATTLSLLEQRAKGSAPPQGESFFTIPKTAPTSDNTQTSNKARVSPDNFPTSKPLPNAGRPWWQYAAIGTGAALVGGGIYFAFWR